MARLTESGALDWVERRFELILCLLPGVHVRLTPSGHAILASAMHPPVLVDLTTGDVTPFDLNAKT